MKISNDNILRALKREPVDHTPVWLMRQAGRYLPEYREVRRQVKDFVELCQNPQLACEVTLQPLRRYDLDAAILFSDILTIPDAMGLGLHFVDGHGPRFHKPVRSASEVAALSVPEPRQDLSYVLETVDLLKSKLSVPLLGFSGSPWTLATYMVEGQSSKTFSVIKAMRYQQPQVLHELLSILCDSVTQYLLAQIQAGCNAVMVFDTWGGVLTTADYQDFSLQYMQQIVANLKAQAPDTPIILFTKNGSQWLELIAASGCDAVSVDWTIDIGKARERIGGKVALQGNLDPATLYASPSDIRQAVQQVLASFGKHDGHVFNLGHGMQPDFNPEHVAVLIESVHEYSKR